MLSASTVVSYLEQEFPAYSLAANFKPQQCLLFNANDSQNTQ